MTWTKYYVVLFAASAVICWIAAWRAIRKEQILNGFFIGIGRAVYFVWITLCWIVGLYSSA